MTNGVSASASVLLKILSPTNPLKEYDMYEIKNRGYIPQRAIGKGTDYAWRKSRSASSQKQLSNRRKSARRAHAK